MGDCLRRESIEMEQHFASLSALRRRHDYCDSWLASKANCISSRLRVRKVYVSTAVRFASFLARNASLVLALSAYVPAYAGVIFLSGDHNIGQALDGSGNAEMDPGNRTWFRNVLGSGTVVKIQSEIYTVPSTLNPTAIQSFYNSLSGVSASMFSGQITEAALVGVDLFYSMSPEDEYTTHEKQVLFAFLRGGGTLFLAGDQGISYADRNGFINGLLADLGSSMALDEVGIDSGFNTTMNIDLDPYNAGVETFTFAFTTTVSGGTSLLRTTETSGALTFVAYEAVIPEPPSILLDIKPGSFPNSVNLKSKGVLPVAILGTDEFDVNNVNIDSLLFGDPLVIDSGGTAVSPLRSGLEDVSGDGLLDLILKFSTRDLVPIQEPPGVLQ